MSRKALLLSFCSIISTASWADVKSVDEASATEIQEQSLAAVASKNNNIATPSFSEKALVERYILDELKATRHDLQDLERRLTIEITDRE